jgi:hypothetical protein
VAAARRLPPRLTDVSVVQEAGYRIATLQSSDMGSRIHAGVGFRELFRDPTFVRQPGRAGNGVSPDRT